MTKWLLRALNGPLLVFLFLLATGVVTALFKFHPIHWLQPDLGLLLVIWLGLKRELFSGGLITLAIGVVHESHSSVPQGVMMLVLILVFLAVKYGSKLVVLEEKSSIIYLTLVAAVLLKLLQSGAFLLLSPDSSIWGNTLLHLFPAALVDAFLAGYVFQWLDQVDKWTYRFPMQDSDQYHEDELWLS